MAIMELGEILEKASRFPSRDFGPGEVVLAAGSATGQLLFLRHGAVDIVMEEVFIARITAPGSVFGDMAYLLDQSHTAEVVAVQPSSFHVVDHPEAFLEAEPRVAIHIAEVLARRLNAVNHLLVEARNRVAPADRHRGPLAETLDRIGRALHLRASS